MTMQIMYNKNGMTTAYLTITYFIF